MVLKQWLYAVRVHFNNRINCFIFFQTNKHMLHSTVIHVRRVYLSEVASLVVLCRCIQPQVLCLNPNPPFTVSLLFVDHNRDGWMDGWKASSHSSAITRDTHSEAGISKNYSATNSGGPAVELSLSWGSVHGSEFIYIKQVDMTLALLSGSIMFISNDGQRIKGIFLLTNIIHPYVVWCKDENETA